MTRIIHCDRYYLYAHYLPGDRFPFYVGMGKGGRAYHGCGRTFLWKGIVQSKSFDVKILCILEDRAEALRVEKNLIERWMPEANYVHNPENHSVSDTSIWKRINTALKAKRALGEDRPPKEQKKTAKELREEWLEGARARLRA